MKKGWNWLINSRKQHYFVEGRSLCGRWLCLGNDYTDDPDPRYDCCKGCEKKLKRVDKDAEDN